MSSVLVQAAEAVKTALNGASLSLPFTAVRAYTPSNESKDLTTLEVTVVPREWSPTSLTRALTDNDLGVDIGVQKRIGPGSMTNDQINATCDPLMQLVQDIVDLFNRKELPGYSSVQCMVTAVPFIYDPTHILQHRVFTSVIRLTFKLARSIT